MKVEIGITKGETGEGIEIAQGEIGGGEMKLPTWRKDV